MILRFIARWRQRPGYAPGRAPPAPGAAWAAPAEPFPRRGRWGRRLGHRRRGGGSGASTGTGGVGPGREPVRGADAQRVQRALQHARGERRRQDRIELAARETNHAVDARLGGDKQHIGRRSRVGARIARCAQVSAASTSSRPSTINTGRCGSGGNASTWAKAGSAAPIQRRLGAAGPGERGAELAGEGGILRAQQHGQPVEIEQERRRGAVDREAAVRPAKSRPVGARVAERGRSRPPIAGSEPFGDRRRPGPRPGARPSAAPARRGRPGRARSGANAPFRRRTRSGRAAHRSRPEPSRASHRQRGRSGVAGADAASHATRKAGADRCAPPARCRDPPPEAAMRRPRRARADRGRRAGSGAVRRSRPRHRSATRRPERGGGHVAGDDLVSSGEGSVRSRARRRRARAPSATRGRRRRAPRKAGSAPPPRPPSPPQSPPPHAAAPRHRRAPARSRPPYQARGAAGPTRTRSSRRRSRSRRARRRPSASFRHPGSR